MGKTLSKLRGQLITRPIQRFNIESRTEKILAQEKPTPAPKYQTDIDLLEKIRHENPEILEETRNKSSPLDQRLKQVYVRSTDPPSYNPEINRKIPENKNRPMPQRYSRSTKWKGFYTDPQRTVPKGKLSLEGTQELLTLFKQNPVSNSIPKLSEKYRIDIKSAEKLAEYTRIFFLFHVKDDPAYKRLADPHLAQADWVDDHDPEPKKITRVQPAALQPVTRESLRLGASPAQPPAPLPLREIKE